MTCHNMECSSVSTPEVLHLLHDKFFFLKIQNVNVKKRLKQIEKRGELDTYGCTIYVGMDLPCLRTCHKR